eukprot:370367-Pleurochrysis_carterae.AAC.3
MINVPNLWLSSLRLRWPSPSWDGAFLLQQKRMPSPRCIPAPVVFTVRTPRSDVCCVLRRSIWFWHLEHPHCQELSIYSCIPVRGVRGGARTYMSSCVQCMQSKQLQEMHNTGPPPSLCLATFMAYQNTTNDLWHPVKNRTCVADALGLKPISEKQMPKLAKYIRASKKIIGW